MDPQRKIIRRAIKKHSFCTLATASPANRPLVTGVLYAAAGDLLYVSALETSVKVRNIHENDRVAVCIPVRRYPVGPPFTVQFQGTATVCSINEPEIVSALEAGRLKRITSHGEFEDPAARVVKIAPGPRVATYGLGVPLRELVRNPLGASRSVRWSQTARPSGFDATHRRLRLGHQPMARAHRPTEH